MARSSPLGTISALSLSVASSVSIVICNKALMSTLRFTFVKKIQFSLIILLLGVGIATVTDLQLNILAVLTTCAAQIMTNMIQKKFKVSSTQLLYQSCPYQAITLFVAGPFLDGLLTNQNVFAFNYTSQVLVREPNQTKAIFSLNDLPLLLLPCFYKVYKAYVVLNAFLHRPVLPHICFGKLLVIGKTSPVTYQMANSSFFV